MNSYMKILPMIAAIFFYAPLSLSGSPVKVKSIHFVRGSSEAMIRGEIKGYEVVDYKLSAKANQTMTVDLKTNHLSNYFNVLPPNSETALFIGSTSGKTWSGKLPSDGVYTVRVYLMRSAARRKEGAQYTMRIGITGTK